MLAVAAADAELPPRAIERSAGGNLAVFSLASADHGEGRDRGRGVLAYPVADLLVPEVKLSAEPGGIERAPHLPGIAVAFDLWVASLVVQHDLILCPSDSHWRHLP